MIIYYIRNDKWLYDFILIKNMILKIIIIKNLIKRFIINTEWKIS